MRSESGRRATWVRAVLVTSAGVVPLAPAAGASAAARCKTRQELERPLILLASGDALGGEVTNRGEMLGEVRDLVLDRATGRVAWAVVGGNGVLGLGDVRVLVPWEDLSWDGGRRSFATDLSPERLRKMEVWTDGGVTGLADAGGPARAMEAGARAARDDEFAPLFRSGRPVALAGEVAGVEEWGPAEDGPCLAVALDTDDGDHLRVLLAPESFVEEALGRVEPGRRIAAIAVPAGEEGGLWVAASLELDGRAARLRDADGRPLWAAPRHALATDLVRGEVRCDGAVLGEVEALVLDARTGQAVFVAARRGDACVPIPVRALRIVGPRALELGPGGVDRVETAPELLSGDLYELNDPLLRAAVYEHFEIDAALVLPR